VAAVAGSTYSLVQARYTLPQSFGGFADPRLQYRAGENAWCHLGKVDLDSVKAMRFGNPTYVDYPKWYALAASAHGTTTTGQRQEMHFAPPSSVAATILAQYRINPEMLVDTTLEYPYGGMVHSRTIILACLAEAAMQLPGQSATDYEGPYAAQLAVSKERDNGTYAPATVGFDLGTGPDFDFDDDRLPLRGLPDLTL
jgi:hypothetical protein